MSSLKGIKTKHVPMRFLRGLGLTCGTLAFLLVAVFVAAFLPTGLNLLASPEPQLRRERPCKALAFLPRR